MIGLKLVDILEQVIQLRFSASYCDLVHSEPITDFQLRTFRINGLRRIGYSYALDTLSKQHPELIRINAEDVTTKRLRALTSVDFQRIILAVDNASELTATAKSALDLLLVNCKIPCMLILLG